MILDVDNDLINSVDSIVNKQVTDDLRAWFHSVKGIIFIHLNIRSIRKNWTELEVILAQVLGEFDILVLTEISFKNEGELYLLDGYNSYFKSRTAQRGGGLALFIRDSWQFTEVHTECVHFEGFNGIVSFNNKLCVELFAIYRPPKFNKQCFVSELDSVLEGRTSENIVILGDMNIDLLQDDQIVQSYLSILTSNGFCTCIADVTREEFRTDIFSQTCIDHIFARTSNRSACDIHSVVYRTKITDHYITGVCLSFNNMTSSDGDKTEPFQYFNEKKLSRLLLEVNWKNILLENDCNQVYELLESKFRDCYEQATCISVGGRKKRVRKNWITNDIISLIQERDKKFKLWQHCKSSLVTYYRDAYKKFRNYVNKQITIAKSNYYREKLIASKNDPKETWQVINDILGKSKRLAVDEVVFRYLGKNNSLSDITNCFANSFTMGVENIIHSCDIRACINNNNPPRTQQCMLMPGVTVSAVENYIDKLDIRKQPGIDRIRVCDIKLLKKELAPVLTHLINLSVRQSSVPSGLKLSVIKPIYKKGSHIEYSNYRPIAIMSVIEKVLERSVASKLSEYLVNFGIINQHQFGFQKKKGTNDLLILFSDYINSKLNDNKHVVALFIDFSKAFDTLNHSKLISALENIGIEGYLLRWFENYLLDRRFVVKVGNISSITKHVTSGVPQGSILGPVLYLIYVNNMFNCFRYCQAYMYADDTVLLASHRNLLCAEAYLQDDFTSLLHWTHDHELVINSDKTKIVHFCSPYNVDIDEPINVFCHSYDCIHISRFDYSNISCVSCPCIETVPTHVYLGLTVDHLHCWRPHIDLISNRLRSAAFQLYRLKNILSFSNIRLVYNALVESIILYGILAYGNSSNGHIRKIEIIQNRIVKNLAPMTLSNIQAFKHCNLLPFQQLFLYRIIIKYYFCDKYKIEYKHNVNTRLQQTTTYITPLFINKYGARQLCVQIPKIFNDIPQTIREFKTYSGIKAILKPWILGEL